MAAIELYFWPTPNGRKISIMLEECGLDYDVRFINIAKGEQFDEGFLALSPNGRMPALVDREGDDGKPVSIFESGAILQYLGRKTGLFYPNEEPRRIEVEQWLFWQMAGLGPMAGQCHHFRNYAPVKVDYGIERYTNETNRLYGVLDHRLRDRDYMAGDYSIADMATYPWVKLWKNQGQDIEEFANITRWLDRVGTREAVQRGMAVGREEAKTFDLAKDQDAQKILFQQRRRPN